MDPRIRLPDLPALLLIKCEAFNLLLTGMLIHLSLLNFFMKKIALFAAGFLFVYSLSAQDSTVVPKKKSPINLTGRANDHFMIQLGYAGWAGKPDTLNTGGLSKTFNVYF